jgi:hypothetical protein
MARFRSRHSRKYINHILWVERLEDRTTPSITVMGQNITATEGVPLAGPVSLATFADSVLTRTALDFSATVNYGDGSPTVTTGLNFSGPTGGPFTLADTSPHIFPEEALPPAGFTVTIAVRDTVDGSTGSAVAVATVADAPLVAGMPVSAGSPMTFQGVGGTNTSTMDGTANAALGAFDAAIGGSRNSEPAPHAGGFRVISWDGVALDGTDFGGNTTVIVPGKVVGIPRDRFQTQGSFFDQVYAVSGDGFKSVNPNVNAANPALFPAFSPNNIFAMYNDNTIDFHFVLAGQANTTPVPATASGFGCIFRNVELSNTTSIQFFHDQQCLGKFFAPVGTQGEAEFLGVLFSRPIVTSITITLGTAELFGFSGGNPTPGGVDDPAHGQNLVATDDFVYAEPMPIRASQVALSPAVGASFNGVVGTFSDVDPIATPGQFSGIVDWGDGLQSPAAFSVDSGGGFDVSAAHTYSGAGTFPVQITVQDSGGSEIIFNNTANVTGNLTIAGTGGNDALAISLTTSAPGAITFAFVGNPARNVTGVTSISFNGNGGTNTLTVEAGGRAVRSIPGRLTIAGQPPITYTNVQILNFNNTAAIDSLAGPDTVDRGVLAGLTGNARYVELLYLDILGRVASNAELVQWVNFLNGGGTRDEVVAGFDHSAEGRTRLVRSWYVQYLGRPAFNGEEQSWVNALLGGQPEDQVLSGIISSAEFFGRAQTLSVTGTPNQRFVQALYASILGRTAGSGELASWVSAIGSLGFAGVARDIVDSGEYRIDAIDAIYDTFLHRPPDNNGLAGFFNSDLNLEGIRNVIETSDEFLNSG